MPTGQSDTAGTFAGSKSSSRSGSMGTQTRPGNYSSTADRKSIDSKEGANHVTSKSHDKQ